MVSFSGSPNLASARGLYRYGSYRTELGLQVKPVVWRPTFSIWYWLCSPKFPLPQPDWPKQTHVTGFPFYDYKSSSSELSLELSQFLDVGSPLFYFRLNRSAGCRQLLFRESALAAKRLGYRAVLLTGEDLGNVPQSLLKISLLLIMHLLRTIWAFSCYCTSRRHQHPSIEIWSPHVGYALQLINQTMLLGQSAWA